MTEKDGAIQCEAGPLECTGHRWQVCVLDKDRNDVVKYLGTIACIEGDESGRVGDWSTKMQNCLTDEERVVVKECFDNRSKELLLEVGGDGSSLCSVVALGHQYPDAQTLLSKALTRSSISMVCWLDFEQTIVEQKVLGSASEGVGLKTLQSNICAAYKGPKSFYPPSCVKLIGEQKEFAEEETAEKEGDAPLVAAGENQAEAKPDVEVQRKEAEKEAAAPAEGGDDDLVVDIKEEPESAAPAEPVNVPVEAAGTGKVKLNMYWRAF
ncbi:hypothetical protein BBJ28_00001930 [Nothophytophthora sp. Chile5]|nr:hypothetical protein BBJ28_00001930 [Nothophytophthora sp. Chile5]